MRIEKNAVIDDLMPSFTYLNATKYVKAYVEDELAFGEIDDSTGTTTSAPTTDSPTTAAPTTEAPTSYVDISGQRCALLEYYGLSSGGTGARITYINNGKVTRYQTVAGLVDSTLDSLAGNESHFGYLYAGDSYMTVTAGWPLNLIYCPKANSLSYSVVFKAKVDDNNLPIYDSTDRIDYDSLTTMYHSNTRFGFGSDYEVVLLSRLNN